MGVAEGPDWVRDFLGGVGTESPGFEEYPATKAQILAAWSSRMQDILSDGEATLDDPQWLSTHLPEGTFQDPGEVFLALCPVITGPALDGTRWVGSSPVAALANGQRLVVPSGQVAFLVGPGGRVLDALSPGEHVISPSTVPQAASASRPPAPGTRRCSFHASPLFCYAGDLVGEVQHATRPPPVPPAMFHATVHFSLSDPAKVARSPAAKELQNSSPTPARMLSAVLGPLLEGLDASTVSNHAKVEALIRSGLDGAGLGVRSLTFAPLGPYGMPAQAVLGRPPGMSAGPSGGMPAGIPPEVLARMPPQARAMMEERMRAAMAARAASDVGGARGASASRPGPGSKYPGALPAGLVACPSCQAPNPVTMTACRACGRPLGPTH
ncbi:MAG: hypothetical protein KGI98_06235 [Euryarchaeota archaeon]|nr:hypothetical protein [Euryarchaeota archaeon]MDE1881008.1 hypothetical protein [Euryarchaeota archaeon]